MRILIKHENHEHEKHENGQREGEGDPDGNENRGAALTALLNKRALWKNLVLRPMILLWMAGIVFVIIISFIPQGSLSDADTITGVDKIARIALFMILSFIPTAFFSSIKFGLCISTSMAPLGFILEMAQKYFPQRHFSPEDIIANNIGTIIGILAAVVIRTLFYTGGRHTDN